MEEHEVDLDHELRERQITETLPWDIIDPGIRKGFLKSEWRRALKETATADCKWGDCVRCGIPGDGEDIKLAPPSLGGKSGPTQTEDGHTTEKSHLPPARLMRRQSSVHRKVRFTFSKTGAARFLSHRQTMDAIERAIRGAALPVHYTEGFNPHIRVSMGPALSLGHEAMAEVFEIDCTATIRQTHVSKVNAILPEGLRVEGFQELLPGAPGMGKLLSRARYTLHSNPGRTWPDDTTGLTEELQAGVLSWKKTDDDAVDLEVNIRQEDGPTASLRKIFAHLEIPEEEQRRLRIVRRALVLRPRIPKARRGPSA
jgi:radical SAM-linked protein